MEYQLVSFEAHKSWFAWTWLAGLLPSYWLPARSRDVELTLHQLAVMLRSGLKLTDALRALQLQAERRSLARVLQGVCGSVTRGESLTQSLSSYKIFPPIVRQLVAVGEQTGTLDQALQQCQEHLARRRAIISEVRLALAYPACVTIASLSIAAYLILYVIPQLQVFLSTLGRELPTMTQSLVDFALWLKINGRLLIVSTALIVAASVAMLAVPSGRLLIDKLALRLPVLGNVLRLASTAALASGLAVMLRSGIRLVEALRVAIPMQHNKYLSSQLSLASHGVERGKALAPLLTARQGFTPLLSSMIEVAERTGSMPRTLDEVAKLCEAELNSKIKRMSRLVEPLVILFAGGIVGYVYIAFFLALMSAGSNAR